MNSSSSNKNDIAWESLFDKYNVLEDINKYGMVEISASCMKEFREPRLMAKFDHYINLPKIFKDNNLAILPLTRNKYVVANFDNYYAFNSEFSEIRTVELPNYIQSIDPNEISSESIALNCAYITDMLRDFLDDDYLVPTVSGRMSSGNFSFSISNIDKSSLYKLNICNSQVEIDAAYEGIKSLAIIEAKNDLSKDFLIRQLYYPYRLWSSRVSKPVRPIFMIYSNGIFRLFEYKFLDLNNYNSIQLVKQQKYSIEDTNISVLDIQSILRTVQTVSEPEIPFPQADSFERIINLCELLQKQELNRNDVTEKYAFDVRQTNYYVDAARYLGLVDKKSVSRVPVYKLTTLGLKILMLPYKKRQFEFCKCVLSHSVFKKILNMYLQSGKMPTSSEIVNVMKSSGLYDINGESTFIRRASTIKSWINWIISLINE